MRSKKKLVVTHHSAIPRKIVHQFDRIDQRHFDLGWGGIGYNHFVGTDGTWKKGRSEQEIGAHTFSWFYPKSWNVNRDSVGVCVGGNFEIEKAIKNQLKTLEKIYRDIIDRYGDCEFKIHKDFLPTACCGKNLIPEIKKIVEKLKKEKRIKDREEKRNIVIRTLNKFGFKL